VSIGRSRIFTVVACCAYPALSHLSAVTRDPRWAATGIALLAWGVLATRLRALVASLFALLTLGFGLAVALMIPDAILYVPPLAVYLALGAMFALTLRQGEVPIVSRFARIARGGALPLDLERYTRTLTGLWIVFFVLMAAVSLGLAISGPLEAWSLFTNLLSYVLIALFFVVEYAFRRIRFRHHVHGGFVEFLRRIPSFGSGVWTRPPRGELADDR
jgi:uncharacterized membrane protein